MRFGGQLLRRKWWKRDILDEWGRVGGMDNWILFGLLRWGEDGEIGEKGRGGVPSRIRESIESLFYKNMFMPLKIMKFYKIFSDISYMQLLLMNNHKISSNTDKSRQYSFTQRLQNWTLQQRERTSGMRDVVSLLISIELPFIFLSFL